jgi:hypothetical protein
VNKKRWDGCDFINAVANKLSMYLPAKSCALVLFSRFYSRNGWGPIHVPHLCLKLLHADPHP